MPAQVAVAVFVFGIAALFVLDRDRSERTSGVLWIPTVWLLISSSRAFSQWMAIAGLGGGAAALDVSDQYLEGSPADRNLLTALLAIGVFVLIRRRRTIGAILRANGPALLFFAAAAASVTWSDYPDVALKRWTKALGDPVMVLVVLTDPHPAAAVKRWLSRVGFLVIPISVLFIKYIPDLGREYRPDFGHWALTYTGITTTKSGLGMITLVFGIASGWRFLEACGRLESRGRTGPLAAHGVILAMAAWLFTIVNSKTSLTCFVMALGLLIAVHRRGTRKRAVVHALVLTILAGSIFAVFLDSSGALLEAMGRNRTLTGRTMIWELVLGMTDNAWIGTGFESFWLGKRLEKMWSIFWWHPNEAHNGYLEIYLNLGWLGIVLLAVMLMKGYRNIVSGLHRDPFMSGLRLACFVTAVVYNITESAIRSLNPIWITFLLAIMAVTAPVRIALPDEAGVVEKPVAEQEVV